MCIVQIWTYRECGCHHHHQIPCDSSFESPLSSRQGHHAALQLSNRSSASDPSPTSASGSMCSNIEPLPSFSRQCSIQHFVHKSFLEPICDDCLLEELGLQPELGPILGGRDRKEGLHGEEWLLESTVEIKIDESHEGDTADTGLHEEDGADADDEGEFRGRSERRRGIDLNRVQLGPVSHLSTRDKMTSSRCGGQALRSKPESRPRPKAIVIAKEDVGRSKSSWSQHLRDGLRWKIRDNQGLSFDSFTDNGNGDINPDAQYWSLKDHQIASEISGPRNAMQQAHNSHTKSVIPKSTNDQEDIASLYDKIPTPYADHPDWSQHLQGDLQQRQMRRFCPTVVETLRQRDHDTRAFSLTPSSPQMVTLWNSGAWPISTAAALSISSSEFNDHNNFEDSFQEERNPPPTPLAPIYSPIPHHVHTTSTNSTFSISSFLTAQSSPSSPPSLTPPTTANALASASGCGSGISVHPLQTPFSISSPHRPSLTPRTSSLYSPPASSTLLHSTPSLHQSPTSAFVCVHEHWAFRTRGCEETGKRVRSCICQRSHDEDEDGEGGGGEGLEREEHEGKENECHATNPLVLRRWFSNPICEGCLGRNGGTAGEAV